MNRRPTVFNGVAAAALLGMGASILVLLLTPLAGLGSVIRLAVPLLSLIYLVHTLKGMGATTGRVVMFAAWCFFSLCCWWFVTSLPFYLLLHAGAIWLIRSLFAYSSLIPAMLDLALTACAAIAFSWAFMRTGSVFLATWCFFLVQALWTRIPNRLKHHSPRQAPETGSDEFEQARRRADAALRQLCSH